MSITDQDIDVLSAVANMLGQLELRHAADVVHPRDKVKKKLTALIAGTRELITIGRLNSTKAASQHK